MKKKPSSIKKEEINNKNEKLQKEWEKDLSEIANLLVQIEKLKTDLNEKEEITKRSQIDYLNLKSDFDMLQRQTQQKLDFADRDITINIVKKFLPLIENLRKSLLTISEEQRENPLAQGIQMMYDNFIKNLEPLHIYPIAAKGLTPDPALHEPVNIQDTEDKELKGKIIDEFQQGFIYQKDDEKIILSPAQVIVGG